MDKNSYKLKDFAEPIAVAVTDPQKSCHDKFVGLEHYDSGEPVISRFSDTSLLSSSCKEFQKNDILIARRNVYLRRAGIAPFSGLTSGDSIVLRIFENCEKSTGIPYDVAIKIIPFVLNSNSFWVYANRHADGMNSKRISKEKVLDYDFELPSLIEQKILAEKLWAAYEVKQSYLKMIEATEEMVKSQFIEMFDFENNSHCWPVLHFSDFASLDCSMTTDYEYYADYPHIGIDSIEQNTGRLFGYRTVREDNVKSGKYIFTPQHIIYSKIRPNLNKVATPDFEGLCSADSYPILANEDVTSKVFLAYLMRSDVFLRYIVPLSNRTGMPKVNREQVEGFTCPMPPKEEQDKFVAIYHQSDKSISELRKSIDAIDKVIKSLINENL